MLPINAKERTLGSFVAGSILVITIALIFFPQSIPFSLFEFWFFNGSIGDLLVSLMPLLVVGLTLGFISRTSNSEYYLNSNSASTPQIFVGSAFISARAGILEELIFRWLFFYSIIVSAQFMNWLFFGFMGFGIPEWLYTNIVGPVANFATFGVLEPYLLGILGWSVGTAIVSSNGRFRNAHTQYKILGLTFVWYAGMYLFWVMFNYGLFAAILMHFMYDFIVISVGEFHTKYKLNRYSRSTYFYPRR